jgi:hypothetical protein
MSKRDESITKHSRIIRRALGALRTIDGCLPFGVLTILIEQELAGAGEGMTK